MQFIFSLLYRELQGYDVSCPEQRLQQLKLGTGIREPG
jgi:hypothetical protein